jgi:hypothetical protein
MAVAQPKDDLGPMILPILSVTLLVPLGLVCLLWGTEGASLYASAIRYVVLPSSIILGSLIAWYWWSRFRAKAFIYKDRYGSTVQDEPLKAALKGIYGAILFSVLLWFGLQPLLRCLVKVLPGSPVAIQTHVVSVGSGKGCRSSVDYADTVTSGTVRTCSDGAPGRRWVGEPVTAHETVGLLGAKLEYLTFDDNDRHDQ